MKKKWSLRTALFGKKKKIKKKKEVVKKKVVKKEELYSVHVRFRSGGSVYFEDNLSLKNARKKILQIQNEKRKKHIYHNGFFMMSELETINYFQK